MPVRVLVVDDSGFFRRQIENLLSSDPRLEVVGSAIDGQEAIDKALVLSPDVITMDIEMPVLNGIDATREIMRRRPIPILMFSSLTTEGAQATFDALEAGAVDFIPKNFEEISRHREEVRKKICSRVFDVAEQGLPFLRKDVKPKSPALKRDKTFVPPVKPTVAPTVTTETAPRSFGVQKKIKLLAIGASTGGPVALQEILSKLPVDFSIPVILVQHMPATFTPAFAKRLNQTCAINIKEAEHGDILTKGVVYLSPGGKQMVINKRGSQFVIDIQVGEANMTYKPSIDLTFSSVATAYNNQALGIILTGMGADGCEGAKKMKTMGSTIWAQDEESCVVYGMPSAVFEAGVTDKVIPLHNIASHILKQFSHG